MTDRSKTSPDSKAAESRQIETGPIEDLAGKAAATASTLYHEGRRIPRQQ